MQFSDLLPFLDGEIYRLQKARDLLAYVSDAELTPVRRSEPKPAIETAAATSVASVVVVMPSEASQAARTEQPAMPIIKRVPYRARRERRVLGSRLARGLAEDSALRAPVPTGPVVVSADAVRKAQATRTEPVAARAMTVMPVVAEAGNFAGWRDRSNDLRTAETLLQRFITGVAGD